MSASCNFPSGSRLRISRDSPSIREMEDFVDYALRKKNKCRVHRLPTLNTSLRAYDWPLACTVLAQSCNGMHTVYVAYCDGSANRVAAVVILRLGDKWRFAVYAPMVSGLPSTPEHQRWLNSIYECCAGLRRCVFLVSTSSEMTADELNKRTDETVAHAQVCTPPCDSIPDAKMMIVNWIARTCFTKCLAFDQTMRTPTSCYFVTPEAEDQPTRPSLQSSPSSEVSPIV
jgi:hypothetical protein